MYRQAIEELKKWKDSSARKPLIIRGARQVGKTWLMKEFGRTECGGDVIYVNFDHNRVMEELFSEDLDPQRILTGLELYSGKKIMPNKTLLIFDEVQEVPAALTSLKYFCEDAREYMIVCAGSLLGIALHPGTSFPVGKVDFLRLYPMSFQEFLLALGMDNYLKLIRQHDFDMLGVFRDKVIYALKLYYYTGGMPEAVAAYVRKKDFQEVRMIQQQILDAYDQDFSKHAPSGQVPRIRYVWQSVPSQLSKENKKFVYGLIRKGARAKEFETAIMWLSDCGLVHRIPRVNAVKLPLKAYEDLKAFKLYVLDVGLLGCMSGLDTGTLVDGNRLFTEFKGALTEQYVIQQLICDREIRDTLCYYTNERNTMEIDCMTSYRSRIVPIEVKAEENLKAKSLKAFSDKFDIRPAVRTSMSDYRKESWLINIPLYAIGELLPILRENDMT